MKLYFKLAIRNLLRHKRRTLLTLSGMALGFAVLLWLQCILKGTNRQIVDNVTSTQVGHLQVWKSEYLDEPLVQYTFEAQPEALLKLLPAGSFISERVHLPSLASSGEQSTPIMLNGIRPDAEAKVTQLKSDRVEGDYLSDGADLECQNREIFIGKSLATLLKVGLGDKVVILAQAADGTLGNELLRVKGIFDTGSKVLDRSVAYASIGCVRKIGAIQGDHEVTVKLPEAGNLDKVRTTLSGPLSKLNPGLRLTTWKEAVPALAGMVTFNDATLLLISLVLFGVTTFGIVNTLLMSVFERTREFGVMLALAVTPSGVCLLILIEAAMIGISAAIMGTLIGVLWVLYHQHTGFDLQPFLGSGFSVSQFKLGTIVYPVFSFGRYFTLVSSTVVVATVAGLIPALHAARMDVIQAIRHR